MTREQLKDLGLTEDQIGVALKINGEDIENAKADYESELNRLKIDFAVEKALTGANARNIRAVKALLDLADAKLDKDGTVKGLSEQINNLAADEGTKFLFDSKTQKFTFKGFQPGISDRELLKDAALEEDAAIRQAMGLNVEWEGV